VRPLIFHIAASRFLRAGVSPLRPVAMLSAARMLTLVFILQVLVCSSPMLAQDPTASVSPQEKSKVSRQTDNLFNFLNMAGTMKVEDFRPMTQGERTRLYVKTMANPLSYAIAGFHAGVDQASDDPQEWEQGASGYLKRFASVAGGDAIARTAAFGLSSLAHEDNRYFNSGKVGFWPRTGYALSTGILSRHDNGSRNISISLLGGAAAGAFLSRLWQPPSESSLEDGAVAFGLVMSTNTLFGVVKEFLPDLGRAVASKRSKSLEPSPVSPLPTATCLPHCAGASVELGVIEEQRVESGENMPVHLSEEVGREKRPSASTP
jgi:hypothetical protein